MKEHFGINEDGETLCGIFSENIHENWDWVNCKKCLKRKEKCLEAEKRDEKEAIKQMGDMAKFLGY